MRRLSIGARAAPWRRTLLFVWVSQFCSSAGFSFALPFAPFYIQELGVTDPTRLKYWVAFFVSATPLSLAIFSPIWGALADRYGRRIMLLRATFAGSVVLALMGMVRSVEALILLRLCQGVFTGTMTAAQAMVAGHTPEHRSGLALGTLSAAVFSGAMLGAAAGGWFAARFGYRATFGAAGIILLASGLLVAAGTRETAGRAAEGPAPAPRPADPPPGGGAWPILLLIFFVAAVRQFDVAFLPLLVQEIHGSLDGVSSRAGLLYAAGGVAGLLAGLSLGRIGDRVSPVRIGFFAAIGAAVCTMPQSLVGTFPLLLGARFGTMFCAGGLDPAFQIWLAKMTPEKRRGFIFGWAGTARSVGWVISPLVAALFAARFGVRCVLFTAGLLYLLLIPAVMATARGIHRRRLEE